MIRTGTTLSRPVTSLSPDYQAVVEEHFGNVGTISLRDVQAKLGELKSSSTSGSAIIGLKGLLQEVVNPNAQAAVASHVQSGSTDSVVNTRQAEIRAKVEGFLEDFGKEITGQPLFKDALARTLEARLARRVQSPRPLGLVLGGPSGIGKTSGAQALARMLNDDPNVQPIVFNCADIGNTTDLSRWKGASQGYVGFGEGKEPVTPESIAAAGKIPVLLVDEISRAGEGQDAKGKAAVQEAIYNYFAEYADSGNYRLNNKVVEEFKGGVIIFTTNAGYEDPALSTMTVEQKREHYARSAKAEMPTQMVGRLGEDNIIGMDELSAQDIAQIAKDKLASKANDIVTQMKAAEGFDLSFDDPSKELLEFLGEACTSRLYGTRNLMRVLDGLVQPILDTHDYAEDGQYKLVLDLPELEKNKLIAKFQAKDGIPAGLSSSSFPVRVTNSNAKPKLFAYTGQVPFSDEGVLNVLGAGAVGGRSYVVLDKGDFDSEIELYFLKPGAIVRGQEVPDSFTQVAVPDAIKGANYGVSTVDLDENRALFLSTSLEGDAPVVKAFLYDATQAKPFKEISAPPVALSGAGIGAVGGKVVVLGGREIRKLGDDWSPAPDLELNNGLPMQLLGLEYDPATDQWRFMNPSETNGFTPRANMATVVHDGKLFFIGGEETVQGPRGTLPFTQASASVEAYNPDTRSIEKYTPLKSPIVGGAAISRPKSIEVLGGKLFNINRQTGSLTVTPQRGIQVLNTAAKDTTFKVRGDEELPESAIGADVVAVSTIGGSLVGPLFTDGSLEPTFLRYAVPQDS